MVRALVPGPAPRMLAALRHLAEHPGSSSREVAAAIGVTDDGQVSRLMSRLSELALVRDARIALGQPRAWHLTDRGRAEADRGLGRD